MEDSQELPGSVPPPDYASVYPPSAGSERVVIYSKGADGKMEQEKLIGSGGPGGQTTIIDTRVEPLPKLLPKPIDCQCPECKKKITTVVKKRIGWAVFANMCILCIIGFIPIFFIPICCLQLYDSVHYCPNCDEKLGRFKVKVCKTEEDFQDEDL